MPWTTDYKQDTAEIGLGTAVATFTDDGGHVYPTQEQQIKDGIGEGISEFVAKAKATIAALSQKRSEETNLVNKIKAILQAEFDK